MKDLNHKIERKFKFLSKLLKLNKDTSYNENLRNLQTQYQNYKNEKDISKKKFLLQNLNNILKRIKWDVQNESLKNKSDIERYLEISSIKQVSLIPLIKKIFPSSLKITKNMNEELDLGDIHQPIFKFSMISLLRTVKEFLSSCSISFNIEFSKIDYLVEEINNKYHCVPYHNFSHGCSVMQVINYMFQKSPILDQEFSEDEKFVSFIASLGHDLGHRKF